MILLPSASRPLLPASSGGLGLSGRLARVAYFVFLSPKSPVVASRVTLEGTDARVSPRPFAAPRIPDVGVLFVLGRSFPVSEWEIYGTWYDAIVCRR